MKMSANGLATSRADSSPAGLEPEVGVVVHPQPGHGRQPGLQITELSGFDSGLQDVLDPALVGAAALAELSRTVAGQRRELVQEHPHVVRVAVDDVEQLVAEHGQLLRRRPACRGDAVCAQHHLVHHPVVDGGEELLLGADVVVERALAQVVRHTELRDARGVVAAPGEHARRRVDDRFVARLPVRLPPRITGRFRVCHSLARLAGRPRVPVGFLTERRVRPSTGLIRRDARAADHGGHELVHRARPPRRPHARQGDHGVRGRDARPTARWPPAWPPSPAACPGRGVGRGDVVALLSYNCPEFLETIFAANYLGAIAMPINWRLAAPEVRYILEHSGARALVCDEALVDVADEATRASEATLLRACIAPTAPAGGRRWPSCGPPRATADPSPRRPTTSTA